MDESWTLPDLVAEVSARLEALPPPKNGQVRAVPDERTIRYYATLGLLDRPSAMRGRTALYGPRHLAQVVAIKRMQSAGHSLAEIQGLWSTLDDQTLARLSGVAVAGTKPKPSRYEFWKQEIRPPRDDGFPAALPRRDDSPRPGPVTSLTVALTDNVSVVVGLPDDAPLSLSPADVRALRAAAAQLVDELAKRGLTAHGLGTLEEGP